MCRPGHVLAAANFGKEFIEFVGGKEDIGGGERRGGARDVVRLVLYKILKHIRRVFQLHYSF